MPKLRIALLVVLAGALAFGGYQRYQQYQLDRQHSLQQSMNLRAVHEALMARDRAQQAGMLKDHAIRFIPAAYPRPQSGWFADEQLFYEHLLAGHQYDVLVAPLQVDGDGYDRATRLLMTAELTAEIARSAQGKIPDAYVINQVFGEGRRSIEPHEIYRIAALVGARRIVWGGVGHDQRNSMHVTIFSQVLPAGGVAAGDTPATPIAVKSIDHIRFDSVHCPVRAFEEQLPDIVRSLGLGPSAAPAPPQTAASDVSTLPVDPMALLTGSPNPVRDAYLFSLFYQLTPSRIERVREVFAVRAYMAARQLSSDAPESRVLRARALSMLGYRPAAVDALGPPGNDEERELSALLNGDLPTTRAQASKETNPLKRLIAELDVDRIEADFGIQSSEDAIESVKSLRLPGRVWPYLVARAATDWDPWAQFDNATLKALLDGEFPIPGYDLPELVRGRLTVDGDRAKLQSTVDLSVFNHARTYAEKSAKDWCCDSHAGIRAGDYLEVLAAIGHDNLMRRVDFLARTQRSPAQALSYAESLQSVYKGDPYYELTRSEAELKSAQDSSGAEREGLLKAAYEDAFNAMFWEQGQSTVAADALTQVATIARHEYGYFDNFYAADIPFHPLYITWGGGGDPAVIHANGEAAVENATSQFAAVRGLMDPGNNATVVSEASAQALEKELQGRFIGSPERNIVLADRRLQSGDEQAAASLLRDNIMSAPHYEDSYYKLGKLDYELGRPQEAADVFLSYPGLRGKKAVEGPVAIANIAGDMGSHFYASGDFKLAAAFYRIAAGQDCGADSEMAAAARLKLLAGDIPGAAADSLERAQRYHDSFAYRDYLAILHAGKGSVEAWSGFNALVREPHEFAMWQSALVGHHRGGGSEAEVRKWAEQPELQGAGNRVSYATSYLVLFATTDRIPSESLAAAITSIDRPTWQFEDGKLSVVRPDADDPLQYVLGPPGVIDARGVLPVGAFNDPKKHRVRPALSFFVEGYRAVELRDFPAAKKTFADAAVLYDMASEQSSYMLPYFALASAEAGSDVSDVAAILARFSPADRGFDYQLTSAVLAGIRGQTAESLTSLKLARYRRHGVKDDRPTLSQYTYGEICELLYELTKKPQFRDEALDWARSREVAEPWHSWSYAIDAALATDSAERERALAMLSYLDPRSRHLSSFKKSEIDAAVRRYGDTNVLKGGPRGPKPTAI